MMQAGTRSLKLLATQVKAIGVQKAFILGAGLGNRLRPLTDRLPKPLVPLFHRPLAAWAMEACARAGAQDFAINTHHLPGAWENFDLGVKPRFFHEPRLLETGGGLKNIQEWIGNDPLLVHNGDIFSSMPLGALIAAHRESGLPVTLALRSHGLARHIALDSTGTRVTDIRKMLGHADGTHIFSGIYCIQPSFLDLIPANEKISVIPAFLALAKLGQLGAITLDDGVWLDLGDRDSYLQAHRQLALAPPIHPAACVDPAARLENSVVGPGAVIEAGAIVKNSVIWPNSRVSASADLDSCVVFSEIPAFGIHRHADI
jgi:NDP-sugar pyrophosphorylase family protein